MSRIAKTPILLPKGVEIVINKEELVVKGPNGTLTQHCNKLVKVDIVGDEQNEVHFSPAANEPNAWAQAGTARAIVNNMIEGVSKGFTRTLELVGVGYRAQVKPGSIALSLGFSHPVEYTLPANVTAESPSNTVIILKSIDKQLIGQVAAEIRSFRPPEPYKGKGIRYAGEQIIIKETKKK
jgi:large subunit ribosomal protein L6